MRRSNAIVGILLLLVFTATPGWTQNSRAALGRAMMASGKDLRLLDRRAGLRVDNVALEEALLALKRSSGVPLAFSPARIPSDVRASCACGDLTVREALDHLLRDTPLEYEELAGQIVLFPTSSPAASRRSNGLVMTTLRNGVGDFVRGVRSLLPGLVQDTVIAGVVVNARTGEPVQGAQVVVEGTGRAAVTDEAGRFRIGAGQRGNAQLRVTMLGYRTWVQAVRAGDLGVRIALQESAIELDELVVTGTPFEARRRTVPNPITVITAEQIEQKQVTNMVDLLRGELASVFLFPSGGDMYALLYARGNGSWTASDQMKVYVDGVEVAEPSYITLIDPRSIERIEVVRGPQASVIYGSEASSGILQIFTKKGGRGGHRPVMEVKASVGVVESDYKPLHGKTPLTQEYTVALDGGTRETFSYHASANYTALGEWVGGYDSEIMSVAGAMRASEGPVVVELTTRWSDRDRSEPTAPLFWRYPQSSCSYCGRRDLPYPNYKQQLGQSTIGLSLSYSATPKWQHNLILGQDESWMSFYQPEPQRLTPADTFVSLTQDGRRRRSIRYNTALEAALARHITGRFTAGADYWFFEQRGSTASRLLRAVKNVQTSPSTVVSGLTNDHYWNAGVFGMAEIGFRDRLHLTLAVRVEEMPNLGEEYGRPVQPRAGLAYVRELGPLDVKLRAQVGKGVRMPPEYARVGGMIGSIYYLPNPHIGPEEKVGWDGGLELYWGRTASLAVTRYDEEGRNLIHSVTINPDTTPVVRQYQNLGVVGLKGWEIEGSLNVGRFSLQANYSYSDNRILKLSDQYTSNPTSEYAVGDPRVGIPKHAGGGTLTARFWRGSASVNWSFMADYVDFDYVAYYDYRYGGDPYRGSMRAYYTEFPTHWKWNFRAQQDVGKAFTVFFRVDNLTNNQRTEASGSNVAQGRTTVLGARLRY